uniref:Protein kinase domain-containing protein n=1 Tax=Timema bartmani TaxID=61472 RepID=A0A7R9I319_9NEOP|nr:unnamed protein product [Timema bartmani]
MASTPEYHNMITTHKDTISTQRNKIWLTLRGIQFGCHSKKQNMVATQEEHNMVVTQIYSLWLPLEETKYADTDNSEGRVTEEERGFNSPGSTKHEHSRSRSRSRSRLRHSRSMSRSHSRSPTRSPDGSETEENRKQRISTGDEDEDENKQYVQVSPKSDIVMKPEEDELPPYLPAIQGCRSVDEFQCLNRAGAPQWSSGQRVPGYRSRYLGFNPRLFQNVSAKQCFCNGVKLNLMRIEEGTYGVVYRAKDLRTAEVVALKRLKMEKEKEGFPITSLREINTLLKVNKLFISMVYLCEYLVDLVEYFSTLEEVTAALKYFQDMSHDKAQHSNIVTVREIVVGSNMDKIYIVMDYVEHDLKSLMETMKSKKQVFIPGEVKCLMQQLLRAVAHLHDNWILHRDLKTSNLLLSHKGILKVGDFGLAREYGSPLKGYTPIVVTLWYRTPELLLCAKEYSTPVDMWSVGCIFGEFLTMEALFPGKSEVDQLNRIFKDLGTPNEKVWPGYSKLPAVQKMTFTEYPVSQLRQRFGSMITDTGMDLMNKFLTYDPTQRVTAEDALKHDYFSATQVAGTVSLPPTATHVAGTVTLPLTTTHIAGTVTLLPQQISSFKNLHPTTPPQLILPGFPHVPPRLTLSGHPSIPPRLTLLGHSRQHIPHPYPHVSFFCWTPHLEAPLPIDPAMFPTWPAKSELGHRKAAAASPKPPPGGAEYRQMGDTDEDVASLGFHMGTIEKGRSAAGAGFSLKF